MTTTTMTARQMMQAARISLIYDQPFFGALALRLKLVEDPGCGTAYTDGSVIGYDPAFVSSLTMDEVIFLVAHEVMHCANGHIWRRDGREPERFNIAADLAINPILVSAGFRMPTGGLLEQQFVGKSVEWIYARLQDAPKGPGGETGSGDGSGKGSGQPSGQAPKGGAKRPGAGGSDVRDAPAGNAGEAQASEAEWQQAVQQAAVAAKARGNLPAALERFASAAAQPRVDWRSVLRRFLQQSAKADYSWTRPSARHLVRGLYLPALRSEAMGPIAVAVDTSGSIDRVTLDKFFAEINAVASEVRPERIVVIYCDAAIQRVDEFEPDDVIEARPKGGGGTSHVPVMNYVDAMEETPAALICLTDLATAHRPEAPSVPVLWATTNPSGAAPYGEVVSLEGV